MKIFTFFSLIIVVCITACNIGPQPIEYGKDGCHYCKMTIVDRNHASQLITNKGKVFKFDAIECMMHYTEENLNIEFAHYLVCDFNNPGALIDATNTTYLISEKISSPMGAYLSGFETEEAAEKTKAEYGGELYNWNELLNYFKEQ